jgi:hypothetical protein
MTVVPQPGNEGRARRRRSAILAAVVVVALLLVTVALFEQGTPATNPAQEVKSAYASHLKDLESENLTAVVAAYQANATVVFKGSIAGIQGSYVGARDIKVLYDGLLSPNILGTLNISNLTYAVNVLRGGRQAAVNSTFVMHGNSTMLSLLHGAGPVSGAYVASIVSFTSYVLDGDAWLISNETWDFATFNLTT